MPRKNPNLDEARSVQLLKGQWTRLQLEARKHPDLGMRPTEMLRILLDEALAAREGTDGH